MNLLSRSGRLYYTAAHWPEYLSPFFDFVLRLFVANVFIKSGLTKIQTWDSTLYLFREEYHVPLLSPEVAAWLATSAELGLSILLVLGLFGRFAAAGLFILNATAVLSYPELSEEGISHHIYWGLLLAVLLILSRGKWSVDAWIEKRIVQRSE